MMPISEKISRQMGASSWIRKMFEEGLELKKRVGADNVYDFTLGNPDVEPPAEFARALRELAGRPVAGMHQYMPNAGFPAVRAAVARYVTGRAGVGVPAENVVMTVGAGGALNVVLKTILDPGDEVIILAPYFVEYLFYIDNHGGRVVTVETDDRFDIEVERLASAITPRTKAVLINSPNNPTGVVYGEASLRRLADCLRGASAAVGHPIYLVSDEPYRKIVFDGGSVPDLFPLYDDAILVTSHSKDLGLAGERIGYIVVHPRAADAAALVGGMTFSIRILGFVNAPALMQLAIKDTMGLSVDPMIYERRRDLLYECLTGAGFEVVKPAGAFYMFPRSPIEDDVEFVRSCLKWNLLVVPGRGFGRAGYFRISLTVPDRILEGSLPAWREAAKAHGLVGV